MSNTPEFYAAAILMDMSNASPRGNKLTIQLNKTSTVATRSPNAREIKTGIPCGFSVKETFRNNGRVDKEYFSPTGQRFRSMVQVRKAQGTI